MLQRIAQRVYVAVFTALWLCSRNALADNVPFSWPRSAAEIAAGVTPRTTRVEYGNALRYGVKPSASAATNVTGLQNALDVADAGGPAVYIPAGSYSFNAAIALRDGAQVYGDGPFSTILNFSGSAGFTSSGSALNGISVSNLQLNGDSTAAAAEDGITITGDASGGFPKLVLRNLLVRNWGDDGVFLQNVFDCVIEDVNSSSNAAEGFHLINSFGCNGRKLVAYNNTSFGMYLQSSAGSHWSGTLQENAKNGLLGESLFGDTLNFYMEQNGHSTGATAAERAQLRLTQRAGGFKESSGNTVNVFALGGKGSTSPTLESNYGVYLDFAKHNRVGGTFGGHLIANVIFTSNSSDNDTGIVGIESQTGLAGGDSPVSVTNNGTRNFPAGSVSSGTFTATLTGCTSNPTGTASYYIVGNVVTLNLPSMLCTSNATTATITGLPTAIRPTAITGGFTTCGKVRDNDVDANGAFELFGVADSSISLFKDCANTSTLFTGSGQKGNTSGGRQIFVYPLN